MSEKRYNSDIPRPMESNSGNGRERPANTDNQDTCYIDIGQNDVSEETRVYKPLKRVSPPSQNQQQEFQRRSVNDYESRGQYQQRNPQQEFQRRNVNDYENRGEYQQRNPQRRNVNDYENGQYRQRVPQNNEYDDYNNYNNGYDDDYVPPPPRPNPPRQRNSGSQNRPAQRREPQKAPAKKKRRRKSGGCLKRIIMSLLSIFIVIFAIYSALALTFIKKMEHVEIADRSHYPYAISDGKVRNILIIGTDTRDSSERGRSDTMILLSLNSRTNQMYLTSIMRDSYVEIEGYGWDKLTHAYSYGGAELLMDTIERNFSVRIDDYIAVNFNAFAAVVDAVDGIEIEVSDAEAQEINTILQAEVNELMGDDVNSDLLESGGKLILNGKQALSYSRIRYVGNSDFERTQRQRDVIMKIVDKVKGFNPSAITGIMKSALPQLSTNMSTSELYLLSLRAPFLLSYDLEQQRIPAEDTYYSTTTDEGGDALGVDFDANLQIIKDTVFG